MAIEANTGRRLPTLAHGQMRPRSAAEAGGCRLENGIVIDRHLERKLVGSLTNSYLFQPGGLVKKVSRASQMIISTVSNANTDDDSDH